AQTVTRTTPSGGANVARGNPSVAAVITSRQIGAAPSTPEMFTIGRWSGFPTQTPTTRSGVNPIVQLSRNSLLVPVFTAAPYAVFRTLVAPKLGIRADGSLSMSATRKAVGASTTGMPSDARC